MLLPEWTHVACSLCDWRWSRHEPTSTHPMSVYQLTLAHLALAHSIIPSVGTRAPVTSELSDSAVSTLKGCDRLL